MSDTPFADALAQLGPDAKGGILVRGEVDSNGNATAKAVVAVRVGDNFHLGAEFTYDRKAGYSAAGEVLVTW